MKIKEIWYLQARSIKYFFHRQILHFILLLALLFLMYLFDISNQLETGQWLGLELRIWFWLAIIMSILHQLIVWLVFRLQLGWAMLTKVFGKKDLFVWGLIFFPLLIVRPLLILGLAKGSKNTLAIPVFFSNGFAVILLIPALYALWSVIKYFGLIRASGGDHFRTQYRKMPFVKKGAFKYSNNAMYKFAFFLLWAIALFHNSRPALL